MKIIERLLAILLFLVLVGFAIVNTTPVDLQFIGLDVKWKAPLVVFLLLFFGAGVVCGLLAVVPTWFRQKREITRLKKSNKKLEAAVAASAASGLASQGNGGANGGPAPAMNIPLAHPPLSL